MEAEQYDIMSEAEERHWWYLGLRDAIRRCLASPVLQLPPNPRVLDAGCGTGGNLRFLSELLQPSKLAGFDVSDLALTHARRKCPQADVYYSDIRRPDLPDAKFDLIVSCDVLYVPGIADSRAGLEQLAAALTPGGLLILNLPAYAWLTSTHDRAVHTRERYVLPQVRSLLCELGLTPMRISYRLCSLFPLLVLTRLPSLLGSSRIAPKSELWQPARWLNRTLLLNLQCENQWIASGRRLPFGSSIFAIGRKQSGG